MHIMFQLFEAPACTGTRVIGIHLHQESAQGYDISRQAFEQA